MPTYVVLDFETASCADLRKVGAWRYAEDPSTFILCLGYKVVTDGKADPTEVLTEKDIAWRSEPLFSLVGNPDVIFVAHNANFEQAIWRHIMVGVHGWPPLPPDRWHDTMAVACRKTLPPALDNVGALLRLPVQKDKEGHRLMMQMCKPGRNGFFDHDPVKMDRLVQYNVGDVDTQYELHRALGGLGPEERRVWILDQKVNQRGIRVDVAYVRQCMGLLEAARAPMERSFCALTGGISPTQRAKTLEWIQKQGVRMFDLRKATLDAFLDPENELDDFDDLPANVLEVIKIRRVLASSSVAKLGRMIETMNFDGRIRGTMQYHGARTGRTAGRLVQPLNMPRPTILSDTLTQGAVMDMIRRGAVGEINEACGNVYEAVISTLRGCFAPAKGHIFAVGDFNAIEARIVLALAGEYDRANSFDKGDPYSDMAASIYGRPVNKRDHPKLRHDGKTVVLGCLAEGTKVLTHSGWRAIETITTEHRLWDGEQWVEHQGLLKKGLKPTLSLCGLWLTPDHLVWCGGQTWFPAEQLAAPGNGMIRRALAIASANWKSPAMWSGLGAAYRLLLSAVPVANRSIPWLLTVSGAAAQVGATCARSRQHRRLIAGNTIGLTPMLARMMSTVSGYLTGFQRRSLVATDLFGAPNAAALSPPHIRTGESGCATSGGPIVRLFSGTFLRFLVGTIPRWKWTGWTTRRDTSRVISASLTGEPTTATGGPWQSFRRKLMTYDIAFAGPNNRFTVATDAGPLVVHNCGFQMSAAKFALVTGKTPEFSERAVGVYRKEWAPLVPKLWYGLDDASTKAVWCNARRAYEYRGISYQMRGQYLVCRLPSGREIYYFEPKREQKQAPWDRSQILPAWSFLSFQGKRIQRKFMFGGLATENVVQATARDIMVEAMFRCEGNGLPIVFTVYDELIAEPLLSLPDPDKLLKQCMEERSDWVKEYRIPIMAECETMHEYAK
jgi:DNA polymerase